MHYLASLNANQTEAALWDDGPLLVLAGPGSGKTKTLTARVARIIEQSAGESFRLLCLTFTRKAATEMRDRLNTLVPDARNRALLTTFHSFATDVLRQHGSHFGLSPDFEILEKADQLAIIKGIIGPDPDKFTHIVSAEKALESVERLFQRLIKDEDLPKLLKNQEAAEQWVSLFSAYKASLLAQNSLDYGAILYFCEQLLSSRPRLARQLRTVYKYVCVDEFQDTNYAQYQLMRALAPDPDSNLFIVGDDDQIIYQWNGASPARILELEKHFNLKTIQLPENYRCPSDVVELANSLIAYNQDRSIGKQPLRAMREHSDDSPVNLYTFDDEREEVTWIAEQISGLLESRVSPREIVVLARNSKLLEKAGAALNQVGVEAHVQKRKSQFESAPLRFVMSALKLAVVRTDDDLLAVLTKALSDCIGIDIGPEDLAALTAQSNGDHLIALGACLNQLPAVSVEIRDAVMLLGQGNYADFLRRAFDYFDSLEAAQPTDSERETFVDYLVERSIWQGLIYDLGGEYDGYRLPLGQFLQEVALANKTPEAPHSAVRCLTIHASKGMEFNHVFLMGLAEEVLPSFQAIKAGNDGREVQEERRNCFVAITRTMETLTLTVAGRYNNWRKAPSRFLREMGFEL